MNKNKAILRLSPDTIDPILIHSNIKEIKNYMTIIITNKGMITALKYYKHSQSSNQ
jgi:hypothetical protein